MIKPKVKLRNTSRKCRRLKINLMRVWSSSSSRRQLMWRIACETSLGCTKCCRPAETHGWRHKFKTWSINSKIIFSKYCKYELNTSLLPSSSVLCCIVVASVTYFIYSVHNADFLTYFIYFSRWRWYVLFIPTYVCDHIPCCMNLWALILWCSSKISSRIRIILFFTLSHLHYSYSHFLANTGERSKRRRALVV